MALNGEIPKGLSYSKSNHPAQDRKSKGLGGAPGKTGTHVGMSGKENPHSRSKAYSPTKGKPKQGSASMSGMNPLFHPGNKMSKG